METSPKLDRKAGTLSNRVELVRTASLARNILVRYGLLFVTLVLIVLFTILLPSTFLTLLTFRSILSDQSIVALVSLAQMIPLAANKFDLSVGYGIGLAHILSIGFQVEAGLPWQVATLIVCAIGLGVGIINGLLVEAAQIDSFIATLGTGSILYAVSIAYTGGQQIVGQLPGGFTQINDMVVLGIPAPAIYVLMLALTLWICFEYLPIGRYIYAIGANPRAAELVGIPKSRYVVVAFAASGLITAFAGIVLGAKLQIGQSNVGPPYLLPSFVGALLGSTAFRLARVNVWGTIVAVVLLSVGIAGIEQLGSAFYVEPLFNGITLLIAVGLAGLTSRRQKSSGIVSRQKARPVRKVEATTIVEERLKEDSRSPKVARPGRSLDRFGLPLGESPENQP
jgi:ribose transport system permease protein